MTNFFINLRNPRLLAAFGYDVFISALAFWLAVYLRFDTFQPVSFGSETIKTHFLLIQICLVISFLFNGLYQGLWRFSSLHDLMRVIRASGIALLSGLAINYFVGYANPLPRSIYLIHFVLVVMGLGGGRFLYRFIKDYGLRISPADMDSQRVLVIGAGTAGARIVRDIQSHPNMKLVVVGLIDDDQFKQGKKIHEVKVVGTTKDIPTISSDLRVDKIFVAIPTASSEDIKRIYDICEDLDIELKVLPKMDELFARETGVSMLRKLQIEDLLGRQQVQLDLQGLQGMLTGKVLLVSGAGGSIGSELCHQIAKFNPAKIIFYEVSEFFLYTLEQTFREKFPQIPFEPVIGDIRNRAKLELVFNKFKPQYVFHAAAYKHVPMMEFNPEEALETNVKGTQTIAETALKFGVEKFVLISTDKAVNPTNVMGASKRIAEMCILDLAAKSQSTKFIAVRFGNVLGSNGSVIPLFRRQIEERQDITVTDPNVIRYFMSIPEASQLVLQAGMMGQGGEIFVLDMGEPIKIVDLAKSMVRLTGLKLGRDIKIVFTGLRPGEKMFEELFANDEDFEITEHGKIRTAKARKNAENFRQLVDGLLGSLPGADSADILRAIKSIVPEFEHQNLTGSSSAVVSKSQPTGASSR